MTRRTFFKGLVIGFGLSGGGIGAGGRKPVPVTPSSRDWELGHVNIAGLRYHAPDGFVSRAVPGEPLRVVAEPENPYDSRAVRIEWRGHHVGYIPRRYNYTASRLLSQGADVRAVVTDIVRDEAPWRQVRIAISMRTPVASPSGVSSSEGGLS